jgi:phosphohistidine phosphatase
MTKTITLIRHLKSSWDSPSLDDRDRPLNSRGKAAGPIISAALLQRCPRPDLVLCSPAQRTHATLGYILREMPDLNVRFEDSIYDATIGDLTKLITTLDESCQHLMLIGHNPAVLDLLWCLCPPEDTNLPIYRKFPTGAVACLKFSDMLWQDIGKAKGKPHALFTPKSVSKEKEADDLEP